jgi:PDZ domain-containing protein/PEGA domain-containing protein
VSPSTSRSRQADERGSAVVEAGLQLRKAVALFIALLFAFASAVRLPAQQASAEPPEMLQARTLFDALDYEQAIPMLDRAIMLLEPAALRDPGARKSLVTAYELRARARFGTGNRDGAVSDFRSVLALNPSFTLGEAVSPRVVALLDEVKLTTVGILDLQTTPGDVSVQVDGVPVPSSGGKVSLATGAHSIKILRPGYKSAEQPVIVTAGQTVPVQLRLERVSTVLTVVTSPPDVEVLVNGVSRGKTGSGAIPASLAGVPAQLGVPPSMVSQPFIIGDIPAGTLQVDLRRPCYATEHRQLPVEGMSDVMLDPVKLAPATGTLEVDSEPAGATVWIDGEQKGLAPITMDAACAGSHTIELRGASGRGVERVVLDAGGKLSVKGRVRPAFALLAAPVSGNTPDPRLAVERAFASSTNVVLYAPPSDVMKAAMDKEPVNDEWFGLVPGTDPAGSPAERRTRADNLTSAFESQGIAWVKSSRPCSTEMQVALAVPGALQPDVLTVVLDQSDSVQTAISRLDTPLVLSKPSLGLAVIDVLDVKGVVIVDTEQGQPGAQAGLKAGEIIESVDGTAVTHTADLDARLASHQAGDKVTLTVRAAGANGASRQVPITLTRAAVLLAGTDRFMPSNAIVAVLRSRLAGATEPEDQAVVQLNLGAALLRAGDAQGARAALEKASLPAGPGVSKGTVEYLIAEAAESAGDRGAAALAYQAAAQAEGRLSADGPLVKSLATRALERLK